MALAFALLALPATAQDTSRAARFDTQPDISNFPDRSLESLGDIPEPINRDPVAQKLAQQYAQSGRARTIQRSSYVMYPYGEKEPVVTCAPLRTCLIELQRGEKVISILPGDTGRWLLEQTATGPGGETPVIAVKPTNDNLTTNLAISTNRRVYNLTLDAPPVEEENQNPNAAYTARVKFYYPEAFVQRQQRIEELQRRRQERQAERKQKRRQEAVQRARRNVPLADGATLTDLNFNYSWDTEKDFPWEPREVFDDGRHTYIKLPPGTEGGEIPLLFDISNSGKYQILNYTIRNNTFITDRVFDRAALVIGVDKRGEFLGLPIGSKERVRSELIIRNREPVPSRVPPENEHDGERAGAGSDEGDENL